MFKPKEHHVRQSQVEKFTRYSIRKVSFGAASVAVATGLFFLGGGSVQAAEQLTNPESTEVQNLNDKSPDSSKEVAGQSSAIDKASDGQKTSSVKESTTDKQNSEVKTPNVVTEKVAINTASLEDLVAKVESRLSQLTEDKKTKSVIDDAKNLVNKAKELLNDDTKTQEKVDAQAKQLSSSLVILNSIKSEATEEKETKNQDPRNGKAIPGKGESGFRADAYKLDDSNNAQLPDTATTGTDKFTFVALPENDPRRNSGAIALAAGRAGDIVVYGTGAAPTDLEIEMYSSQRTGQVENPVAMSTVNGEPATSPGRMDYPLSKEQVQKLQEEAKLWRNKEKPDGNRISNNPATVFGSSGAYEFLATEIYKLGYEQGVDRVYIPNISNRFAVTEKAKEVGWKIKSIEPSNMPPGLIYDRESDSVQGRVVANLQNGVYDFRFDVAAENEKTHQIVRMKFQNLRSGWIGWQDTQPPKIEVSNDAYEVTVGQNVNIEVKYSDDAGSNFSGDKRRVKYTLKDGRVVEIGNQSYRQAVSGLAGYPTTKNQGTAPTSIPGVDYDLSRDKTPTEKEANGDEKIFGKGMLIGSPTKAGIYTVSVFAKDYNNKNKSDTTWIHSGHEVQKYMTVVVKPTVTVKNIHAYATNIPVTISEGASSAELTLPNGKVIKLEAKNGNWALADGGAVLGPVGGEINVPVSQEDTKDAAVDTIKVKAITENVKATLLRNEIELLGDDGQKHAARLSETTGHWELEDAYKEVRTPTSNGGYKLTKRQVYTEVQADGSTNYYIYSYTRTFNADDKVVSVDEVTRPKTVVPRLNTENTDGATTIVEYDAVTKEWKSSDGSNVTATKEGDFWKVRTESGFTGLIKGSKAESLEDKGSILNDAPTASSTSYTTVKGATVDLVKQASAAVTIRDTEDDATTSPKKETTVTKVTVTAPSGKQTEYTDIEQAKAHLLSEVGTYTVKVEVKDSNGNVVTANTDTETGTDKGAETAVNSTTYTITVEDQPTNKLYTVEDDTVTNDQLKEKVNPTAVEGFTPTKNDITDIPTTAGKAGQTLPTPATVTYTKGTETISVATKVDVVVLPKVTPEGVKVLKDSTGLEEVVKAKATEAATATTKLPDGVTVRVKEVKAGTVPATTATGVQTPATAVVEYVKDGNVVASKEVEIPVTVVGSTASKVVVFEGEKPTAEQAKEAVTPGTDGIKGEPTTLPETAGKAGATDVKVDVPVTYDNGKLTETVSVPVTVLPKASGEVEVPKGESVDKVKEVAKAKATELVEAADFKGKLPTGATVTVGDITEEVLATITAEKGTNKGVVNVPATYTVDGKTYPTTIPVTINVLGSEPKPVYTVEGTKPDAEKVKNAVTPGTGGTTNAPIEAGLPDTTGKAGATDVTATTTVTYPNGTETVTVPVTVLPKATPEKVITLKDTTGDNLTTAVKEKAQAALGKLTLPTGVTVELDPNQTYTVPATDSNGDKDTVPVKVQYKDATGTVVAEDTITVPVTVVSSTPSKIVVFEGEKPTAEQAKEAVTPGTDGTKGEPTTLPETAGKAGATDVKVDVPVTYDNGKLTETVSVPVTVLPKASGEVEVPKGESVDKVKEVAKAKATELVEAADFKGKLPTGATVTVGDITEEVLATITAEKGTNKGVVNVPATYTVDGKTYPTTIPVTINVLGSEPKPVYTVEGTKPDAEKVKNAVTPGTGGTTNAPIEAGLPDTTGKAGATDVTATTTVTYPNGTETVTVPVTVLPKATPEKVITLKDTTGENLTTAVKEKAQAALGKLTLPSGVTVELVPNQNYAVPATDSNGDKDNVPVKVQYKDATGTVVVEDTISVPVTVVSSTPSKIVVFEGDEVTADAAKGAVTPGTDGTKGEPTTLPETAGKAGATDVKVDVPVTYDNGKLTETVSVPVTVLPKPEADEILVAKNSDKEKAKEKVLAQAEKAIADGTFTGKLPQGATVTVDNTVPVTIPELTDDTEVDVTVKYTVDGQEKTTTVKVPVTVVESVPQIVPVDENNKQPDPEKSIDKTDYPEGSTFRYKTPDGQTSPIDVTTPGDKDVIVEVLDKNGNPIVEVPATVRVVGSTPQFVVADPTKKQPEAKDSVTPGDYPEGTTFEYKTPVDTTTTGEKDVTVVAKLNGQPIAEVPAKVVVVDPKTQYVVADPSKPQPDAAKSIDPEQYPDGTTFEYKTPVDTTTPGEKDVVVVAKNGEDKLVEVPTKVKVVQGNPQIVPVDEGKKQPSAEDSIDPNDYPEDATFEYKEEVDTSKPGDKKVTVVVKQGDKVLVEVPSTVRVVESYPKYVPVDPAK
ncbi:YSIRK-type signal peptide-containing protein, partial [uncultured Streptococcus sp.]|uniref:YSIRK-type signal peptide-containing protein n=1 Tax=uncultured Streptococcus sp. TaxID=83427 RepID=UPI0028D6A9D5